MVRVKYEPFLLQKNQCVSLFIFHCVFKLMGLVVINKDEDAESGLFL